MIGAFGAGAAPNFVLQAQSQYSALFTAAANDVRITGLKIVGSGTGTRGLQCTTGGEDTLIMGCEVTNSDLALVTEIDRSYLFDNNVHDIISYGLYMAGTRSVVLGNQIVNISGFHNIRIVAMKRSTVSENIVRWNGSGYHCIKLHAATYTGSNSYSEQIVLSGNVIQGTSGLVISPQNSSYDERIRDVLVERSTFIGTPNDTWLVHVAATSTTFRNNIIDSSSQNGNAEAFEVAQRGVEPAPDMIEAYNNVFIKNGNSDTNYHPIAYTGTINGAVRNNIIYCATFTGTLQTGWDIGSQGVSSNNLVYFPKTPSLCDDGTGTHVATNPLFVSVDASNADYLKLQSTSPAIDRGHAGTTARRDYAGTIRSQGSAPDLGIYEYTSGTVAPVVTSFTPTSGPGGTSVTITGTNFTGATAVAFNGIAATYTVNSSTQITASVPTGATTGIITVTTAGGSATSATSFTVSVAPTITSFTPTSGPVGTSVTITGTNFTGATGVAFHGIAATYTVNSSTQITAFVPTGATTGAITVTTAGGSATSATSFTVSAAPTITAFTPASGPVGTAVTITGTGFTGATAVAFSGTAATYTVNSATKITATVPTGVTTGVITVTTAGGTATSASVFTVKAILIVTVSDSGGSGCGFGSIVSLLVCTPMLGLRTGRRKPTSSKDME
ncbi:MAG: IPT/TIG domain-containing protein [Planctomycetes bacterium]|nr:IPT/TIG domain-containing protein [Planctomycetota bacterium]